MSPKKKNRKKQLNNLAKSFNNGLNRLSTLGDDIAGMFSTKKKRKR